MALVKYWREYADRLAQQVRDLHEVCDQRDKAIREAQLTIAQLEAKLAFSEAQANRLYDRVQELSICPEKEPK